MANLKYKNSNNQWKSLSAVRGPKGDNADITLNGTSSNNISIYAPVSSGLSGQILQSNGANKNPTWIEHQMPTVNNAILDIQKNGTSLGTFSANANENKTINIEVPIIENSLVSTDISKALSANQGYILNQKFNDYAPASSLSNYLPLSGGTVNGIVEILGAASSQPFRVRGIVGSIDTGGSIDDLYIQYKANKRIILGNNGAYNISADGSQYSGNSATATKAIQDGNGNNIIDTYTNDSIMATHDGDYNATYTAGSWNAIIMPMNKVKINTNTSLYSLSDNRIKVSKAGNYLCSATMNISNGDNQWSLVLYINDSSTSMMIDSPLGNMANATLANYIVYLNENETITWGYRCSTDNSSIIMRGDRSNFTLVKL